MDLETDTMYDEEPMEERRSIKMEPGGHFSEGEMIHEEIVEAESEMLAAPSSVNVRRVVGGLTSAGNKPISSKMISASGSPVVLRRSVAGNVIMAKPSAKQVIVTKSTTSTATTASRPIKIIPTGQKFIPKLSNIKFTSVSSGQVVGGGPKQVLRLDQNRIPAMKRKPDGSPMVVKIDGLNRLKTIPVNQLTTNASHKIVRAVGNNQLEAPMRVLHTAHAQTEICGSVLEQYQQIIEEDQQKIASLEEELRKLKYTPEMFMNDDKRTEYFTGIDSFTTMMTLYNSCEGELPDSPMLTKFEIFILTLLKLRLKLPIPFLGYQFGVSSVTANHVFNECLSVLHKSLRDLFSNEAIDSDGK